jgi:hypothetical protein
VNATLDRLHLLFAWAKRRALAHLTALFVLLPVALFALALAGYGWWWQVVGDSLRTNVTNFQAQQAALGREVKWDAFDVNGFPYRVLGTVSAMQLMAPDRGASYTGERIVVHLEPFSLNRIAFSLEGQHRVFYARERWIEATARADKALVTLAEDRGGQHAELDIGVLTGKAKFDDKDVNFIVEMARGGLTLIDATEREAFARVDLLARLKNVALQGNIELPLGSAIAWLDLDIGAKLPGNMAETPGTDLVAAWRATGTPLEIRRFELEWGGVSVAASGEMKLDQNALPEGRLTLTLGNHPRILDLLRDNAMITPETQTLARKVLDVLAFMSGDEKRRVSVPLRIEKGAVYLGPAVVARLMPEPAAAHLAPFETPTASP